jgi:hypothetical protein
VEPVWNQPQKHTARVVRYKTRTDAASVGCTPRGLPGGSESTPAPSDAPSIRWPRRQRRRAPLTRQRRLDPDEIVGASA